MGRITKSFFGETTDPLTGRKADIYRYCMTNSRNMSVAILTRGATIQSIKYQDKDGNIEDVCLGFDTLQEYIDNQNLYMGATVGRIANCVAGGILRINDEAYQLKRNLNGKHHINGGFNGFNTMIWEVIKKRHNSLYMRHVNDKDVEGYPGQLTTYISFVLDDDNNFMIGFSCKSKKITPVNITNYLYLNLAGHHTRKEGLFRHNIMMKSKEIVDCDREKIPTGSKRPVKHTPYDLRKYVNLGRRIKKFFTHRIKGFDVHYCIDDVGTEVKPICKIVDPCSGRYLEFSSNQPTVHFLTCNDWPDIEQVGAEPLKGKDGAIYAQYGAFCLAAQQYPDAGNQPKFPNILIGPSKSYSNKVIYHFGCCD